MSRLHSTMTCVALLAVSALGASCGTTTSAPNSPSGSTVSLFFLHGGTLGVTHKRVIPSSSGVGSSLPAAALEALLSGPTNDQLSEGLSSAIPAGVRLMSLSVSGGTAIVNLSSTFSSGAGVQPS